ncbi:CdiA C-terminal domain-containing protein [Yoonia sp. GPGPB17]|uniref:CdiA C-terminal domain-containing protein n=1 Tax=Yoonia sp. GPGPB17 TaxID=3026147 RepID=UPI0040407112
MGKVTSGQTQNVVVNLADTSVTPAQVIQQLTDYPIPGLQNVIIIDRNGVVLTPLTFD